MEIYTDTNNKYVFDVEKFLKDLSNKLDNDKALQVFLMDNSDDLFGDIGVS
jgi:hypothetical protein